MMWRSLLSNYAATRKVAGLIADEVAGFFNCNHSCSRTVALWPCGPVADSASVR
jgi:hypothetical protein